MNGFLMFVSSLNKYKKISIISMILWSIYMICKADLSLGYIFPLINLLTFLLITNLSRFINNKLINKIYSIFSILLWSIAIDIICYYIFPNMTFNLSIFTYIFNGILFNIKFVVYNIIYLAILEITLFIKNKINEKKSLEFNNSKTVRI